MEPVNKKTMNLATLELFKDSIRRIKNQKQRPGFERIAQTLKTHHSYTNVQEIKQNLDIAVRDGLLLPVWTKGLECYKDPENLKSLRKFTVMSAADVRRAVKAAVREIGDPLGSKIATITNYVRYSFAARIPDLDGSVMVAVEVLAKKADLIKVENNRFRSMHIAPPDNTGRIAQDSSSSTLLDGEDEDFEADEEPAPSTGTAAKTKTSGRKLAHIQQMQVDHNGQFKAAPRRFLKFQCWCCRFFTTSEDDFLKHVGGRSHGDRTAKKIIYCNSCHFRSRDRKKLVSHLKKHKCHADKVYAPSCLLTFGLFTSLTLME